MNLPKTGFPMRAGLSKSEPKRLKDWQDNKVYELSLIHISEPTRH